MLYVDRGSHPIHYENDKTLSQEHSFTVSKMIAVVPAQLTFQNFT